jgi:glycosyltransferase involved in cell wall biosynthesis
MNEFRGEQLSVSLIVATVGRTQELNRLLESIAVQSLTSLELIIVDQNADDRVKQLLEDSAHSFLRIHVRSPRGLSRARNVGINLASGRILCFPDDDCWYPGDLLPQVVQWFDQHQDYHFLCCTAQDGRGREVASRWPSHSLAIDRDSVLRACASASLFIRRTAFQSAEDSDLALRCMSRGGKGWFAKQLYVYHPDKGAGEVGNSRALGYGMGFGYLLRKHRYSPRTLIYHVVRALGGLLKSIILAEPDKTGFYWNSAYGRLRGYLMPMFDKR